MLFSTVFDYTNGLLLEYFLANKERFVNYQKYRKIVLTVSVVGNLGILCFFKYTEFLLTSLRDLTGTDIHIWKLALPIGISFYTFQTMSYTIDVYRQKVKAQHNLIAFGMYVSMFPQLIAGPIVRYASVEQQMNDRVLVPAKMAAGLQRFIIGLGKKVLLANQIGALWTEISPLAHFSEIMCFISLSSAKEENTEDFSLFGSAQDFGTAQAGTLFSGDFTMECSYSLKCS